MNKTLRLALAIGLTATALTACGNDQEATLSLANSQTTESSTPETTTESATVADAATTNFDHGDYFPKYRTAYQEITNPGAGQFVESTQLANNFILPFEVDPSFDVAPRQLNDQRAGVIPTPHHTMDFMPANYKETLKQFEDRWQSGYYITGDNKDATETGLFAVMRVNSPETASEVVEALATTIREDDGKALDTDPASYKQETWVEALPNGYGFSETKNFDDGDTYLLETVSTHNEFVIYTWGKAPVGNKDKTTTWVGDFLDKQIPLLPALRTRKTDAGVGLLDTWAPIDEHGLLRYAVDTPAYDNVDSFSYPATFNARGFAANKVEMRETIKIFELAGVDHIGRKETAVAIARNAAGAEMFQNAYLSFYQDADYQEYEEPQNLPGTTCVLKDLSFATYYECIMVNEEKVAFGSTVYFPQSNSSSSTASPGRAATEDEAKKQLSQLMAAQYLIFEDAKTNPQGSPLPAEEQVGVVSSSTPATSTTSQ